MHLGRRFIALSLAASTLAGLSRPVGAATENEREFHLPAQALGPALRAIAHASGLQIMMPADAVEGHQAPPLEGHYTPEQAIERLLAGSGLSATVSDGTVIIRGRSEPSPDDGSPSVAAAIVVTGSRIRGAPPTSPVIGATRTEIEDRGITDLGSYARSLPQNYSGGQNPGVISSTQTGSENFNSSSTLNLRGIGPDATLTLLDGHRLAYDATNQGIDISAIPLAAIDRIEIVADGASALYGSDAVGGVANVILRRDYDGLETSARIGAATDGGDVQQEYSAVTGRKWATGGFMVAADISKASDIAGRQRSYTELVQKDLTLLPSQRQASGILSFHQALTPSIEFEMDGHINSHHSRSELPFTTAGDARQSGTISTPDVRSYSISPGLTVELPHDWQISLHGTVADSLSRDNLAVFSGGAQLFRNRIRYDDGLGSADLSAEGPLFTLPGGKARLALGGGFRTLNLHASIQQIMATASNSLLAYKDSRTVGFGYGEVSLPFIGNANGVPLVKRLNLSAAVRYERYSGIGGLATPKLGILYQPIDAITLKGTWGKSFKAPTLAQENTAPNASLLPAVDFFPAAPDARDILLLGGGNTHLKPERATSWTGSIEITPPTIPGLRLEFSHFDVHYRNRVVEPLLDFTLAFSGDTYRDLITFNPSAAQIAAATSDAPLGIVNQTDHPFDPANVGAIIDDGFQNAARQHIDGYDFAGKYLISASGETFELQGSASYLRSFQKRGADQPTLQQAGTIFNPPHWRAQAIAEWTHGNVSLSTTFNYIGGTQDNRTLPVVRVGAFRSVDATLQVHSHGSGLLANIDVTLSALNLFNEKPSLINTSGGISPPFDATNYSSIGRFVSFTVSKRW
jgi:outer membrane receptor protein involved in Fe transport